MEMTPSEWSVVIAGRWNRAILTPKGVARRIFKLDPGTNLEVLIPLDEVGRYQIKHQGCVVEVTREYLLIQPMEPKVDSLKMAMEFGRNALESLPETPVTATGVNLKFTTTERITGIDQILSHKVFDDWASDHSYVIQQRGFKRSLAYDEGAVNIDLVSVNDTATTLQFNFEKMDSDGAVLKEWLLKDPLKFEATANDLISHFSRE